MDGTECTLFVLLLILVCDAFCLNVHDLLEGLLLLSVLVGDED